MPNRYVKNDPEEAIYATARETAGLRQRRGAQPRFERHELKEPHLLAIQSRTVRGSNR